MSLPLERLSSPLSSHSRFIFLFGPGADDAFISYDYTELSIEFALLSSLKALGYQRVAFIAPHKPLFFLDPFSLSSAQSFQPSTGRPSAMTSLSGGPLNDAFLFSSGPSVPIPPTNPFEGMGDLHALRFLDALLRDSATPTAAVFLQAESALAFCEDPRSLAGIAGDWARMPASNPAVILLLFSAPSYSDLVLWLPTCLYLNCVPSFSSALLHPLCRHPSYPFLPRPPPKPCACLNLYHELLK